MTRSSDPFDELAAVFLSDPDEDNIPVPGNGGHHAPIELLIAGHLPVRGGLWLTPYADMVARGRGATALIRLDSDDAVFQVLRGRSAPRAARGDTPQPGSLASALDVWHGDVAAWVIRPAAHTDAESLLEAGADRITILSSADQAAVVAAYQILRDLSEEASATERRLPELAVAIAGASPDAAASMHERLRRTTRERLGTDVTLATCLERIEAGVRTSASMHFADQATPTLLEAVGWIRRGFATRGGRQDLAGVTMARRTGSAAESIPEADDLRAAPRFSPEPRLRPSAVRLAPSPPSGHRPPGTTDPADPGRRPRVPVAGRVQSPPSRGAEHAPVAGPSQSTGESAGGQTAYPPVDIPQTQPAERIRLIPRQPALTEPKTPLPAHEPDQDGQPVPLAEHVEGLTALPVRCPGHERVEIAIDARGAMHLLCHEPDMRDLQLVQPWVVAHRELITMACPNQKIAPGVPPVQHVFTSEPRRLADLHGSALNLHVLAPVTVEGRRGWYAAPLNQPLG